MVSEEQFKNKLAPKHFHNLIPSLIDSTPLTTIWPKYRRCAVETSLNYAQCKKVQSAYLVYAGIEPQEFTHIFGYWDYAHPSVREAHDYHISEGKRVHEKVDLLDLYDELTATRTYTVEELMEKPEGVDLMRLEDYLSDEDFEVSVMKASAISEAIILQTVYRNCFPFNSGCSQCPVPSLRNCKPGEERN